jgi:hypothetical protein
MDRSLTYFDDVAAIRVSLELMQKRSGVPLLRFTSTLEVPPLPDPLRQGPTYTIDAKPMESIATGDREKRRRCRGKLSRGLTSAHRRKFGTGIGASRCGSIAQNVQMTLALTELRIFPSRDLGASLKGSTRAI